MFIAMNRFRVAKGSEAASGRRPYRAAASEVAGYSLLTDAVERVRVAARTRMEAAPGSRARSPFRRGP